MYMIRTLARRGPSGLLGNTRKTGRVRATVFASSCIHWWRGTAPFALVLALLALPLAASTVRIIQTNSAGDDVSIIDPASNKVVGVIKGIEVNHGAAVSPDGSRYYISNEAQSTLDVVDTKSLKVTNSIPLSGHPNNISIGK